MNAKPEKNTLKTGRPALILLLSYLFLSAQAMQGIADDVATQPADTYEFDFSPHAEPSIETIWKTELLVEAIVQVESQGNPMSIGRSGERGLMQIKSGTWREVTAWMFGKELSFDKAFAPQLNRRVGKAYLADLQIFIHEHRAVWADNERSLLLACYNAGPNRVLNTGFDTSKLPASNRDYVQRVSDLHDYYIANNHNPREPMMLSKNDVYSGRTR